MENMNTERREKPTEFLLTPENDRAQVNFFKKNITTELSSDFTLPDYLPEIRKLLGIRPRLSPVSRYIGNNSIEFSGRIDYDLIYTGGDGVLASAPLGTDFSFETEPTVPANIDWDSSNDAFADIETDMLHCRVTAPRKVNVKCRLHAIVRAYGYDDTGAALRSTPYGCEKLISEPKCAALHRYMSEVAEIADELAVPTGNDSIRPIISRSNVNITEVNESGTRLNCRGEVVSDIVYENTENGEINTETKRTPFSQEIEIGENTGGNSSVRGICGEIKISTGEGKLFLDTEVILEADIAQNQPVTVTRDIFTPGRESTVTYRDFRYETSEKCATGAFTASASIPLTELSLSDDSEIIDRDASVRTEGLREENGRLMIDGSCRIWVLSRNGDEFSSGEASIPFSFDTGVSITSGTPSFIARPTAANCRCRIDGSNAVCEVDISLPYCILSEQSMRIAAGMSADGGELPRESGITVYYPEKGETLWDVAKKFGRSLRSIAETNDLPSAGGEEDISAKPFLMLCE